MTILCVLLRQECIHFQKIKQNPQSSTCQKCDLKDNNFRHHLEDLVATANWFPDLCTAVLSSILERAIVQISLSTLFVETA